MSGGRLSQRGVETLGKRLSARDLAIIGQVADLRLMSARQIEVLHFTEADHQTHLAAARACRRVLERMVQRRLLIRLDRRVGGVRAGSASYVYGLGPIGQRVLAVGGARLRFREPSPFFTDHTLAITQLVVDLHLAARKKALELLALDPEPACWRRYGGSFGMVTLKSDLYLDVGSSEYEYRWFVEVDRGSEHLPTLITKCRAYDDYYRTGIEQRSHKVFPRVCWIVPDANRATVLAEKIAHDRRLTVPMFVVTTPERSVETLSGVTP